MLNRKLLVIVAVVVLLTSLGAPLNIREVRAASTVTNPGFESGPNQTPAGWSTSTPNGSENADFREAGGRVGGNRLSHWRSTAYNVSTLQTLDGLTNGAYTLRVWIKSSGGQIAAYIALRDCGSAEQRTNLPTSASWVQISVSTTVTNTRCTLVLASDGRAGNWANFDDVEFVASGTGPTSTPTRTATQGPGPTFTPTRTQAPGPTFTPTRTATTPAGGLSVLGADVSSLQRAQDQGQVYFNASGVQQHPLDILKSVGVNYIRLRVWVNPISGYNNKDRVVAFASQVKSRGLKLLIDLHYSDTWADPGKQFKPAAWASHNLTQLQTDVFNHTLDVCNALKNAGATPDMIQVGNEITPGMLFEDGRINNNNFANVSALIKQGYNAVKACNASTQVMLHIDRGGDNAASRWWFDGVRAQGVNWDVTGLSFYCYWHGTIPTMQSNVADMRTRYGKPVVIAETSYPFSTGNGDSQGNVITSSTPCSGYPASLTGQANNFNAVLAAIRSGGGVGVFYWEPTWVGTPGNGWDLANINGTGSGWDNQAVFDFNFRLNPNIRWTP